MSSTYSILQSPIDSGPDIAKANLNEITSFLLNAMQVGNVNADGSHTEDSIPAAAVINGNESLLIELTKLHLFDKAELRAGCYEGGSNLIHRILVSKACSLKAVQLYFSYIVGGEPKDVLVKNEDDQCAADECNAAHLPEDVRNYMRNIVDLARA